MTSVNSEPWWVDRIGYQVYLPSFADSNGDGWGDLRGLISRLGYLAELGVDLLWLSPLHPSPFVDHGYDVSDYLAVNSRYGSMDDVDRLIGEASRLGIRVLLDLVPNHTSSEHEWFLRSRSNRTNSHRAYYIWRDPAPGGGPPNNWVSAFGGPAWTYDPASDQYYMHLFTPSQPDLNWDEPRVADEFDAILRFWLERGVAGFRIDIAHGLIKAAGLPDQPVLPAEQQIISLTGLPDEWFSLEHIYDLDQPGVTKIHSHWRQIVAPYNALLLGEVYLLDPLKLARYLARQDGLHLAFWFALVESRWEPDRFGDLLRAAEYIGPHLVWSQSNHDRSRAVTRYGGGDQGRNRALMLATLTMGLPALPILYQGEELGLEDGVISAQDVRDPLVLQGGYALSRDVARTPMPWAPGHQLSFTTAERAWLDMGGRADRDTAAVQAQDAQSPLSAYRRLLATRHRLSDLRRGTFRWVDAMPPLIVYQRGECLVVGNLSADSVDMILPRGIWHVEFTSCASDSEGNLSGSITVEPERAVILRRT